MNVPPITILVPVLGRPHRVEPLMASIDASAEVTPLAVLFLVSPRDDAELKQIKQAIAARVDSEQVQVAYHLVKWRPGPGDYAKKINEGARMARSRYVFLGADDLSFRPGWAERIIAIQLETRVCVIGTNDGGNSRTMNGTHSTHSLVDRDYIDCGGTLDQQGVILHEGYDHQFVDTELVAVAQARGTYVHAHEVIVEHLHPNWGKAQNDATYSKGNRGFAADRMLYDERRLMWEPPLPGGRR